MKSKLANQKTSSSVNNNVRSSLTGTTYDDSALHLAKGAQWSGNSNEITKESKENSKGNEKEFDHASTKSSEKDKARNFDCPHPTITIRKCGFTSHVLPSQMDICIVADTEEADREYYEEPKAEHVNVIDNFQDKDFDPIEKKKLI